MKTLVKRLADQFGLEVRRKGSALTTFHEFDYLRHTARRLEHLASLELDLHAKTVLEVGAGVGDHTHFYRDRECSIVITEARDENLAILHKRYSDGCIERLDLEQPHDLPGAPFDVVHCYGVLYHVSDPAMVLHYLRRSCRGLLLLETTVSFGREASFDRVPEDVACPATAHSGIGCQPTRRWVREQLLALFPFVYATRTQPNHEEFPTDWLHPELHTGLMSRCIFVASLQPIENANLTTDLPDLQIRHK